MIKGMFTDEQVAQAKTDFDRDGYAVIRGGVPNERIEQWREQTARYVRDVLPGLGPEAAFYEDKSDPRTLFRLERTNCHDPYFDELLNDQTFTSFAAALLGEPVVPRYAELLAKAPRLGNITPAHQDGYYFMLEPNEALAIWMPLDIADEENGCLIYLPGAHKHDLRPHGKSEIFGFSLGITDYSDEDFANEVVVPTAPGDVVVHHSLSVHRADRNISDRKRDAVGLVYYGQSAKLKQQEAEVYIKQLHAQWAENGKL